MNVNGNGSIAASAPIRIPRSIPSRQRQRLIWLTSTRLRQKATWRGSQETGNCSKPFCSSASIILLASVTWSGSTARHSAHPACQGLDR
ncbi:hypothetical protein D3C81_1542120 [compost metagenome]